MQPLPRFLLPLACLLALACADRLGQADIEALRHVEAHIEDALRDQEDRVLPLSIDSFVLKPLDASLAEDVPGPSDDGQDPPAETATPRPSVRPAEKLGEVPP